MAWAATVELILQQHSLTNADLLGEGGEAQVYALGPDHVVRFGKAPADRGLLERMLASCGVVRPELVHGNYCPANLMVGADGLVTGLIDFGPLTVMGDWRMDAAGAVLYLTGMAGVTPEDKPPLLCFPFLGHIQGRPASMARRYDPLSVPALGIARTALEIDNPWCPPPRTLERRHADLAASRADSGPWRSETAVPSPTSCQRLHHENAQRVQPVARKRPAPGKAMALIKPQGLERLDPRFQEQRPNPFLGGGLFNGPDDGASDASPPRSRVDEQPLHLRCLLREQHVSAASQGAPVLPGHEKPHSGRKERRHAQPVPAFLRVERRRALVRLGKEGQDVRLVRRLALHGRHGRHGFVPP